MQARTPYVYKNTQVGRENDNCLAKARQSSVIPTRLDIFNIRHRYIRISYIFRKKAKVSDFKAIKVKNT